MAGIGLHDCGVGARQGDLDRPGGAASLGAASWLSLAAAPVFAIMALITVLQPVEPALLCGAGHAPSFAGMTTMYLLMAAFHLDPWLRMVASRWRVTGRAFRHRAQSSGGRYDVS